MSWARTVNSIKIISQNISRPAKRELPNIAIWTENPKGNGKKANPTKQREEKGKRCNF
jgi:hypothetical protein